MKRDKALSLIGLAQKAGQLLSGYNLVKRQFKEKKLPALIIISEDISRNSRSFFLRRCKYLDIPVIQAYSRDELGHAIGKGARAVVAIMNAGLANQIIKILTEEES